MGASGAPGPPGSGTTGVNPQVYFSWMFFFQINNFIQFEQSAFELETGFCEECLKRETCQLTKSFFRWEIVYFMGLAWCYCHQMNGVNKSTYKQ